jgi:hypothetical protein
MVHACNLSTWEAGDRRTVSSGPGWAPKQDLVSKVKKKGARCWWLMPVILATQEAEIRRMVVPGQPQFEALSQKHHHKKGLVQWLK